MTTDNIELPREVLSSEDSSWFHVAEHLRETDVIGEEEALMELDLHIEADDNIVIRDFETIPKRPTSRATR